MTTSAQFPSTPGNPLTGAAVVKTADYQIVSSDIGTWIVVNSSGNHIVTLPATADNAQFIVGVVNIGTGTVTLARNGHNINGAASNASLSKHEAVIITTDGTDWYVGGGQSVLAKDSAGGYAGLDSNALLKLAEMPVGAYAGAITMDYLFDTGTGNSDPGSGNFRLNNATENTATALYVNTTSHDGLALAALLDTLDASTSTLSKAEVRIWKKTDQTVFLIFNVTSRTSHTGYREYAIAIIASSAASPFSNADEYMLSWSRTGDIGVGTGVTVFEVDGAVVAVTGSSLNFRGAWLVGNSYNVGDVVTDGGSSYVCVLFNSGNEPPNGTYWQLIAQAGATGAGASDDVIERNGNVVVDPCSITALVNGMGPVGEVEANGKPLRNNSPCLVEDQIYLINASPVRALATVYQNNTGVPLLVLISFTSGATGNGVFSALSDASNPPSAVVCKTVTANNTANNHAHLTFFVKPGEFYKVTQSGGGTAALGAWRELKLAYGAFSDSGDVSGGRALSTVYQNTTTKAMFVEVQIASANANSSVQGLSDPFALPTSVIDDATQTSSGANTTTAFMIVPPGYYYKVTAASGSLSIWHEYTWDVPVTRSTDLALTTGAGKFRAFKAFTQSINTGAGVATATFPQSFINSSGKVRWYHIITTNSGTNAFSAILGGDGIPAFLTLCQQSAANASAPRSLCGPVLPGRILSAIDTTSGTLTNTHWHEFDLG